MHTLLIGDMKQMEDLYCWLQYSDKIFEIDTIISETDTPTEIFTCDIKPIFELNSMNLNFDIIFICSTLAIRYAEIISKLGVDRKRIKEAHQICEYLSPKYRMEFYKKDIENNFRDKYSSNRMKIGDFTYGTPEIITDGKDSKTSATIGKFCSIDKNVTILLDANHRDDWCTTYPFNIFMEEFSYIKGHPASKGDVIIGNDVWIGMDAKIMSGVTIGDGSIIAANACVTKDVSPYTIVGGVPAKKIRSRFSPDTVKRLMEIKWWNWSEELIYEAIPLLQSSAFNELFDFYERKVK